MKATKYLKIAIAATVITTVAACSSSDDDPVMTDNTNTDGNNTAPTSDIVDTAIAAGNFTTLATALTAAGLVDTLKGEGPFTVFAPTDDAFAALGQDTINTLLEPANKDQLVSILTYHVLPTQVMSADIAGQALDAVTVNGQSLAIDATNGVKVNNATVTTADILTTNGVIHVIDTVLQPQ